MGKGQRKRDGKADKGEEPVGSGSRRGDDGIVSPGNVDLAERKDDVTSDITAGELSRRANFPRPEVVLPLEDRESLERGSTLPGGYCMAQLMYEDRD